MPMKYTISRDQGFIKFDRSSHGVVSLSAETRDRRKCVCVRWLSDPRRFCETLLSVTLFPNSFLEFLNIDRNRISYNVHF